MFLLCVAYSDVIPCVAYSDVGTIQLVSVKTNAHHKRRRKKRLNTKAMPSVGSCSCYKRKKEEEAMLILSVLFASSGGNKNASNSLAVGELVLL